MAIASSARLLILLALASLACSHATGPSCRLVAQMIRPCAAYLADRVWAPYGACCSGVAALNQTAMSPADRYVVCNCLKSIAPRFPVVDLSRAAVLPRTCGVNLNFTLSSDADCSR